MFMYSFNPYCSGRWSRTQRKVYNRRRARVLILIVVEDDLVLNGGEKEARMVPCLNPCCSGRWSRTQISFPQ